MTGAAFEGVSAGGAVAVAVTVMVKVALTSFPPSFAVAVAV